MTQEEKQLLLKDLCARLPYGVKVKYKDSILELDYALYTSDTTIAFEKYPMIYFMDKIETIKPYLRPMSSMTDDERDEFRTIGGVMSHNVQKDTWAICAFSSVAYDWLNKKMFDYRGLIEKGLALEASNDMYKTE